MRNLSLELRRFIKTENLSARHLFEIVWMSRQSWAKPVLIVSALVLGIVFGQLATKPSAETVLMGLTGLIVLWVVFTRPEFLILLILIMSSSIVNHKSLPGIARLTPVELGIMFMLGIIVLRKLSKWREEKFVQTPLDLPIFLFFLACSLSFLNTKYFLGNTNNDSFTMWRQWFDYMIFFAVTNFVRTRQQLLTLVGGMLLIAIIVAGFMVAQQAVGTSVSIIPGLDEVRTATVLGESLQGVARVSIPGGSIVYVMLLPAFILHSTSDFLQKRRWLLFIAITLSLLAIAFTFSRNMWVGAAWGGLIFVAISRFKSQRLILLILALLIGAIGFVSLFNDYFPRIDVVVGGLTARFSSLFAGDELVDDGSTQWRLRENEDAIPVIKENPILGLGPGIEYRAPWNAWDRHMSYIHNGYLFLLINVGLVGLIPLLWFSIAHVVQGLSSWYKLYDPVLKAIVIGFALSYVALLSSSVTSPRWVEPNFIPLIGVVLGINQVALRLDKQSSHQKSSLKEENV
jgi:O-antigen ligase